jgi:5-methylcytosine-specific restriction endonuclease McrA
VLREIRNGEWTRRLTLLGWRYDFAVGTNTLGGGWRKRTWLAIEHDQHDRPMHLLDAGGRAYWRFEGMFYWEDERLEPGDVLALVRDRERRRARKLERAHLAMALEQEPPSRRQPISRELRLAVFERDGGRCVECDETFDIQYDHVIPVSMGGATTLENLQLLCASCNQRKGGSLG